MQVAMPDGTRLRVMVAGDGPPLLWLPGGPGLGNYLQPLAAAFPDRRNVLADPRGTGESDGGPHGLERAVADLEDLRMALDLDRWAVLGHSWGADLALAYALAHPDRVTAVVSFAGTGVQDDRSWHAAYEARLDDEPHGEHRTSPAVHRALLDDWRRFIKTPDLLARIAALRVPVTFVHAGADIRPGWPARQLAGLVPGARHLEIPGAPHEAWLTHRAETVAVLRRALRDGGGATDALLAEPLSWRPLVAADLPTLGGWLAEPGVARWWHHDSSAAGVERDFGPSVRGEEPGEDLVVLLGDRPVGLLQRSVIADYPDDVAEWTAVVEVPDGAVELDYLIGEPDLRGRGLGSRLIAAAVADTWCTRPEVPAVLVAVVAANVASWRAAEKAGLTRVAEGLMEPDNPADDPLHYVYRVDRPTGPGSRGR